MRRALGLVVMGLLVCGCAKETVADPLPASDVAATDAAFDKAAFDKVARAFVDASLAYAETCQLDVAEPGNWFHFISYDVCSTEAKDTSPVAKAEEQLVAAAGDGSGAPVEAKAYLDQAAIFAEWVATAARVKVTRGTMLSYQHLALAYNRYDPSAKVPTEPKRALDQYFVKYPAPFVNYIWIQKGAATDDGEQLTAYERRRKRGTPLRWRQSSQGPFLGD